MHVLAANALAPPPVADTETEVQSAFTLYSACARPVDSPPPQSSPFSRPPALPQPGAWAGASLAFLSFVPTRRVSQLRKHKWRVSASCGFDAAFERSRPVSLDRGRRIGRARVQSLKREPLGGNLLGRFGPPKYSSALPSQTRCCWHWGRRWAVSPPPRGLVCWLIVQAGGEFSPLALTPRALLVLCIGGGGGHFCEK
jgi:hypothetical protein